MRVTIFEDDKDLADAIKETMDKHGFTVSNVYTLKGREWKNSEIVLADYNNKIVFFKDVCRACEREGIPVLAISGGETGYQPQLLKPFTSSELQVAILNTLANMRSRDSYQAEGGSILTKLKRFFVGP